MEDNSRPKEKQEQLLERLRKSPPGAVAGAFVSFAGALAGSGRAASGANPLISISTIVPAETKFELEYKQAAVLDSSLFRVSLDDIAEGPEGAIYILADGEIKIFTPEGALSRRWAAPKMAACIALDGSGNVYVGSPGRVDIFDSTGKAKGGFSVGTPESPAVITALRVVGSEIIIADSSARLICRFDAKGRKIGEIGRHGKNRGFMLPNRSLDFDITPGGMLAATDPGRHRVSFWTPAGEPVRHFGQFGLNRPEHFVGCCNPVNLAVMSDGRIVTSEKVVPRVKIYSSEGQLLCVIGPEHFDAKCTKLPLAADSMGRILVADPVRRVVRIFTVGARKGGGERV